MASVSFRQEWLASNVGARNSERAEEAMKSLKAEGVDVIGWQYVNLSDNASLEQTAKEIKREIS